MCSPAARLLDAEITLTLALAASAPADDAWDALHPAARRERVAFVGRAHTHRGRVRRAAKVRHNLAAATSKTAADAR